MQEFGAPLTIVTYVLCVALGFGLYFILTKLGVSKAHNDASRIVDEANSKADNIVKEAILDAKTQAYEYKLEAEKEIKEQRLEVTKFENKLFNNRVSKFNNTYCYFQNNYLMQSMMKNKV